MLQCRVELPFLCPYAGKTGLQKKNKENHSLLWKYYGLCLRGVAHLCNVTNTEGYGNSNNGQRGREDDDGEDRPHSGLCFQERERAEGRSGNPADERGGSGPAENQHEDTATNAQGQDYSLHDGKKQVPVQTDGSGGMRETENCPLQSEDAGGVQA